MSERNRPESSRSVVATLLTVTIIAVSLVVTSPPISVASSSDYAITRISDPAPGVQAAGESTHAVISDDGSTLVFTSTATNLTTPATTGNPEVYARDLATGTTDLVSQRPDGSPADAPFTGFARTSADGRYVSFISEADGLVANDSNGKTDVFVRDRQAGTTTRITADDAIYTFYMPPQLSDDGLTILFGAGGPGFGDLLEGEWQSGPLTVVPGIPGAPFRNYALSGDAATIAVGYEEVGERRVGFYDRATDEITDSAVDDIADLTQFTMSDDGQLAAYVSGGAFDTQEIKLLRRGEDTPTTVFDLSFDAAELRNPWLSGDGSTLVYDTYLLDCVTGFSGNCEEFGSVSSYDVATAETLIVSRPCDDCIESGASVRPSVDESGEWIAFDSSSVDLTEQVDINAGNDAFLAQRLGNAAPAFPGGSAITVDQAGATFVDVQWDAAIDDTAVTGYELFVDGASVAIIDGDVTSATVGDLEPDTDYEIGVEAFDTADQRTDRLTVDVTTASGVGAGSAALTGSATSATTASLSWDPANPAGLTGYRVFRSDGGGAFAAVGEVDDTTTEFHDDGLDPDTTYRYRVGRLDGATVSPHTVEREITTPDVTVDRVEFRVEQILGSPFAVLGETARLEAVAAPGLTATATLSYLSWFAEDDPVNPLPAPAARTMTIPLPPDPFGAPGNYVAEFVVDDGIAEIASFAVDVEHPDGASATGTDPALPLDVSAGVRVNVDAAPDAFGFGPEDEWTLTTRGSTTPARDAILLGGGITEFSGFLPSELANIELNTSWNTLESSLVDQTLTQGRFLDAMLVPRPLGVVFFEVFNDEGDPVDGARIDIFDTSTDELRDTRFTGLGGPGRSFPEFDSTVAGEELRFEVSGPGIDPQSRTETIVAGEQTITFTALETLRGTIRGTVLNDDGTPSQSTVAVTQNDDTRTVAPAADGSFEIAAEPGLATVSAGSGSPRVGEGLVVETISVPEPPDVAEVTLRTRGVHEYTIRFDISVVEPDGTVSDGSQYGLRFTGPGNQQFGEARPSFIVTAQRGLEREYCVEAFRRGLPPQCEIVEFGLETVIDVEFIIEPAATVTGTLVDRDDNPLVGSVFQAVVTRPGVTGRPTTTLPVGLTGRNGLRIFIPEPGTWNATISWWDPDTGEVYLTQLSITVAAGQEVDLGVIRPDAAGRFNAKGNAVTVEPPQLLPDELARVRATFVNGLAETRNAAAVLSIPPGTTLDADGTLLDGEPIDGAIDVDGNLVVELGDLAPSATGVLSYHLRIDDPTIGDLPVAARIVHDDAPPPGDLIGIGTLSVAQVTLDGPTRTATGTTPLYGRAPAGSTVTILNAGQEIATTTASAGGRWRATVQLDPLPVPLEHELVASIQFDGGDLRSDALYVSIDPGWPEPIRATVQQDGGSSATWDPRQGIATFPFGYRIPESVPIFRNPNGPRWPPRPINVEVEFENPEQITWLAVTVGDDTEIATLDNGVFTASLSPFELGDISFRYDAQRAPVEADDLVVGTDADFRSRIPTLAGLNILGVNTGTDGARVTMETPYGGEDMRIVNEIRFESGVDFTPTAQQLDEAARAGIPGYVEMVEIDELDDESGGSVAVEIYIPTDYLESLGITFDAFNDQPIAPIRAAQAIGPFSKILLSGEVFALASGAVNVQSFLSAITGGGKYDRINALRAAALECPTLDPNDREFILDSLALTRENALWLDGLSIAATIASFAVGIAFPVGGLALSLASSVIGELVGNSLESGLDAIKRLMEASDCNCPGDPSAAPRWIYDPAGYVFEGVESNRIEGATATVFEGVTETGPFTQWDAVPYAQINPQITGTDGRYAWDVPEGWWQVRYTKDGYLPNESEVLEVLPPHFDVNVGLVPVADPTVDDVAANAGPSGVDVTFSTYMDPTTVDIAVAGAPGSVVPLDEEPDPDGRPLARSYRFLPDEAFTVGDDVEVTVVSATDFAGRSIGDPFTTTVPVVAGESATLSGSVFSDLDLSVLRVDEPGIAGVEVIITDGYGQTSYATTDADGGFAVDVPLGPADVVIVATSAPLDGLATTAPSLAQRVVVGPDGGDATPVGFAPIAGAIDPLTVGDASGGTVEEGSTVDVTVDLTALPEPVVAGLDIDDDGVVDTPADALLRYDAANDDGPAQRTIDVIASDGRRVGTAPVQIEVVNVAPTVMPGTPSPTGLTVDGVIASYTDPGVADTHTAIIQWGDGTTSNGTASGGEVVGSHTYASAGSYDVEVCVGDDDGGVGCTELQVDVADEPTGSTMTPTTVPSPTSTPDATTPATTIPTSPSAGPPAVTDPPMPTMPNGGLPATGSSTGSWLLLALLAIAIGALAVLITRRRPPAPRIQ